MANFSNRITKIAHIAELVTSQYPQNRTALFLFYRKKVISQFNRREKKIGHHTSFRENDDLLLWRALAIKKSGSARVKLCAVRMRNGMLRNDLNARARHMTTLNYGKRGQKHARRRNLFTTSNIYCTKAF